MEKKVSVIFSFLAFVCGGEVQREVVGQMECIDSQRAATGDIITVRFKAFLGDGSVVDSTRGVETFSFTSGRDSVLNEWEKGMLGTCVGEQVVQIIEREAEKRDNNSRHPKQTILTSDYETNGTLYMITDIVIITKLVENLKCGNEHRIKRGDKVTIETTAHLHSAELKGKKEPVLVTLHGQKLWSKPVSLSVGEDQIVRNWNQGIEGSCPGDKRQIIIGPEMEMGRIWNLSGTSQVPNEATVVLDVVIKSVKQDNILHHLFNLLHIEELSKEHRLAALLNK